MTECRECANRGVVENALLAIYVIERVRHAWELDKCSAAPCHEHVFDLQAQLHIFPGDVFLSFEMRAPCAACFMIWVIAVERRLIDGWCTLAAGR